MYPDFGGYFSVASCVFVYTKTTCQTQFGKQKSQLILLMDMKKTKNIILRCTEDEKKKIQDFAKEYGLNVTQYIIKKSLNQPVNINHKEVVRTIHLLNVELSRIGNNVNQLAKIANSQIKTSHIHESIWIDYQKLIERLYQMKWDLNKEIKKLIKIIAG